MDLHGGDASQMSALLWRRLTDTVFPSGTAEAKR
jgi:hypothetical protein